MGIRILYGDNGSRLYDRVTETIFGLLFYSDEDPQDFFGLARIEGCALMQQC